MHKIILLAALFLGLGGLKLKAQYANLPFSDSYNNWTLGAVSKLGAPYHSALRPYAHQDLFNLKDSINSVLSITSKKSLLARKTFNEHLFEFKGPEFHFTIDPLISFSINREKEGDFFWQNNRGAMLQGQIGKNVWVNSTLEENQLKGNPFIQKWFKEQNVLPNGYGRAKSSNQQNFDNSVSTGYIKYAPSQNFDLTFGLGNHFIGDGYRSLLLSDFSFPYTFLQLDTKIGKIHYRNIWAQLTEFADFRLFNTYPKKYMSAHYLSAQIGKRLEVGLFENIVIGDTTRSSINLAFLNPIIFFRPLEFAEGRDVGNSLLGLNLKYKITDEINLYGQLIIDEFKISELRANNGWWGNKYAFQIGARGVKPIFSNNGHLILRMEYNSIQPYMYTHRFALTNYGHNNQALAHPFGANLNEFISEIKLQKERYFLEATAVYLTKGEDLDEENYGGNIYSSYTEIFSEYGNEILQGQKVNHKNIKIALGWLINPKTNLRASAFCHYFNIEEKGSTTPVISSFLFGVSLAHDLRKSHLEYQ